jgi:predicted nicotinamide N-methyase
MKTDRISKRTISDILVYEELSGSIARHLWDAGILLNELSKKDLLKFVQHDSLDKLKILELGTGIGLVSIHLSKLFKNSEILATDLEDSYEVCQKNITYNDADDRVKFSELDWESETDTGTKWDLIVITDCTYNPLYYDSLINVLKREIVSGFTKVVLSHKFRESVSEGEFFVKMESSGFKLEKQIWHNLGGQNLVHTGLYSL